MQFKSTLARLAAFAFFLLSFSMLVCAAPAPVAAPGAGELAARDSSLVARTDYTSQCKTLLLGLQVAVKDKCATLVTCSKTPGCDCAPIIADIVASINGVIVKIKAQVALGATIDVSVCIDIVITIIIYILAQLKLCVGLTVALCASIDAVLKVFIELFLALCLNVVVKATILLKIKLAVSAYIDVCIRLGLNLLRGCLGLL